MNNALSNSTGENINNIPSNQEKKIKRVLTKNILKHLNKTDKHLFFEQVEGIEKDMNYKKKLKIRVRPEIIDILCNLLNVHDIRGGAYRGTTVYLGHEADLQNPALTFHETTHVDQQVELGELRLGKKKKLLAKSEFIGFIRWLIRASKHMSEYKNIHGDSPFIQYEATTLTPMELEAYKNQNNPKYIQTREHFTYKKYGTLEGEQEVLHDIASNENKDIKAHISQSTKDEKDIARELHRLDEVIDQTKDKDWTMRVFNTVDNVHELNNILTVLERKLWLLQNDPKEYDFSDISYENRYEDLYANAFNEYQNIKQKYQRELFKYNIPSFCEDDFTDQKIIKQYIKKIKEDIVAYRKKPVKLWLEPTVLPIKNSILMLEKKLYLIQQNPELHTFNNEVDERKYREMYRNRVEQFNDFKEQHIWELDRHNILSLLEENFDDREKINATIAQIKKAKKDKDSIFIEVPLQEKLSYTDAISLLETKRYLIQQNPELHTFSDEIQERKYAELYRDKVDAFNRLRSEHEQKFDTYNIFPLLEESFANPETISQTIKKMQEEKRAVEENE